MKIASAVIENFLTLGHAEINLDSKGLVLIQGDNRDDPSAVSNGAGKSSVPDAISWCLYGITARGVSGDSVVNSTVGSNCRVTVSVTDGDVKYEIRRHRKHKSGKNALMVDKYVADSFGVWTHEANLTKGTDKLTQEVVDKIMGCSHEVFCAAIYAGQENMPDIPQMTDKQLKVLVEEGAGIDRLQQAYDIAKLRNQTATKALDACGAKLEAAKVNINRLENDLTAHRKRYIDWEDDKLIRIASAKQEAKDLIVEAQKIKATIDEEALKKARTELGQSEKRLEGLSEEAESEKALADVVAVMRTELATAKNAAHLAARTALALKAELENIEKRIGTPCGECGKLYCEDDLDEAHKIAEAKLRAARADVERTDKAFKACVENERQALSALETYRATMTDVSAILALQRSLRASISAEEKKALQVEKLTRDAKNKLDVVRKIEAEHNPYTDIVEDTNNRHARALVERAAIEEELKTLEEAAEITKGVVDVFGPAGVRAHILDTVTPYLNARTSEYLGKLSDGNISAVWNTISTTAKGELREKFNIEVTNDKGADSFAGLSGGEKRKVRLATSMALQDLVASRATKPIDLFIADEVDHALDEAGLERLMGILEEKAREHGTVLVISHNSLGEWIREQALVVKEGGISRIEGVLT